jgi:hypothetical protein
MDIFGILLTCLSTNQSVNLNDRSRWYSGSWKSLKIRKTERLIRSRKSNKQIIQLQKRKTKSRKGNNGPQRLYTDNSDDRGSVCSYATLVEIVTAFSRLPYPEHLSSPPVFSEVRVTRSVVLCVYFVYRCLSYCPLCFNHCALCSSSIYEF